MWQRLKCLFGMHDLVDVKGNDRWIYSGQCRHCGAKEKVWWII